MIGLNHPMFRLASNDSKYIATLLSFQRRREQSTKDEVQIDINVLMMMEPEIRGERSHLCINNCSLRGIFDPKLDETPMRLLGLRYAL